MAPHNLLLKEGAVVICLTNLQPARGVCNGTRMVVQKIRERVLECTILSGHHKDETVFIPRISATTKEGDYHFTLTRRQFPVRLAYAMTVHKSQGQTLKYVGLYLKDHCFSHGMLYVAMSRVGNPDCLKIFPDFPGGRRRGHVYTKNVVYKELLLPG